MTNQDKTAEQLMAIELDETALNDAGSAFVEAMPHALPGPIWNELKPALRVAITKYLNDTRADSGEAVAWQFRNVTEEGPSPVWHDIDKSKFDVLRNDPHAEVRELFTHSRATAVDVRDAARWRQFVEMIDPDLCPGGFTIYYATEKGMDQLCYHGDVTEHVDAAIASREGEVS